MIKIEFRIFNDPDKCVDIYRWCTINKIHHSMDNSRTYDRILNSYSLPITVSRYDLETDVSIYFPNTESFDYFKLVFDNIIIENMILSHDPSENN